VPYNGDQISFVLPSLQFSKRGFDISSVIGIRSFHLFCQTSVHRQRVLFFERLKTTLRGQPTVPNLPAVCLPASLSTDAVGGPLSLSVSTTYGSRRTNMRTDVEGHPQ
jgi:hypothetical protein